MPYILTTIGALAGEGATPAVTTTIDFSEMLTTSLNGILGDFGKYAMIAVGLTIWGAPKAIQLVKKFFNALSR